MPPVPPRFLHLCTKGLRVSKERRDHWTRPLTGLEYTSNVALTFAQLKQIEDSVTNGESSGDRNGQKRKAVHLQKAFPFLLSAKLTCVVLQVGL